MADNVSVVAGAYTATVATDDIGGVAYQRMKMALGAADAYDIDWDSGQQTMANSAPVVIASNQTAVPVLDTNSGSALTSLQLIDDVVHSGDAALSKYAVIGAVLDDAATATVTENNANTLRMSSRRALLVEGVASGTAQAVTEGSAASILTSVQLIDDTVHSGDAVVSKYNLIGAVLDDVGTATVTENQAQSLRMSSRRALLVEGVASGTAQAVTEGSAASILTSVQLIDDTVHSGDAVLSKYNVIGAVLDDAATATVTENNAQSLRMSSRRALLVEGVASGTAQNVLDTNSASALTSLQLIDDMIYTDDTSTHATGTSKGALIMAAATPTDTAVNANDIGAVGMSNNRELYVGGAVAHDGVGTSTQPLPIGLFASAAAPADVSNDTDIVRAWCLRNGAQATVLTAAGALIGGDAANGLDVDVTRVPAKKVTFAASSAITVTNLHSIATSATWVAGWESGVVDNSSNLYIDYAVNAIIKVAAAGLSAGEIRMYLVAEMDDSTWPDVFDGTESTETITDTEIRDGACKLAASVATDTGASDIYPLMCPSAATIFGGSIPRKFVIFITHSTGANLAASGSAVYTRGQYMT